MHGRAARRQLKTIESSTSSVPDAATILAGTVVSKTTFAFSRADDAVSCWGTDLGLNIGLAASYYGDIFRLSLRPTPATVSPLFATRHEANESSPSGFIDCKANALGTVLYLLDAVKNHLYAYTVSQNATEQARGALEVVATFTQESGSALASLAIDSDANVAYVGGYALGVVGSSLYAVNLSRVNQELGWASRSAAPNIRGFSALTLDPSNTHLYYSVPSYDSSELGEINLLAVENGVVINATPTAILRSSSFRFPFRILMNATESPNNTQLYVQNGGYPQWFQVPGTYPNVQTIFATALNQSTASGDLETLFTENSADFPSGLSLSPEAGWLYFTTGNTLYSLAAVTMAPNAISSSGAQQAASTAGVTSSPATSTSTVRATATAVSSSTGKILSSSSTAGAAANSSQRRADVGMGGLLATLAGLFYTVAMGSVGK